MYLRFGIWNLHYANHWWLKQLSQGSIFIKWASLWCHLFACFFVYDPRIKFIWVINKSQNLYCKHCCHMQTEDFFIVIGEETKMWSEELFHCCFAGLIFYSICVAFVVLFLLILYVLIWKSNLEPSDIVGHMANDFNVMRIVVVCIVVASGLLIEELWSADGTFMFD